MKKALVVGINDYPNSPLGGCINDARKIAFLLEKNGDQSPNFEVKTLTSDGGDITRVELRRRIDELFSGEADIALLYFSGHGTVTPTGGYIVTQDARQFDEGISMDEILTQANASRSKNKFVILDCCFSGSFGSPQLGLGHSSLAQDLTVLTSSRGNEYSYESDGSGVFTSLMINALQGGAADLRGNITAGAIYSYVDDALGAWDQRPIFKTNVTKFCPLRTVSPVVPPETMRKLSTYFDTATFEYPLDPSFEDTTAVANPVNVAIFKDLQLFQSVGVVVPVGEQFMYYAAINSKSCKLTSLGHQYWRLATEGKI